MGDELNLRITGVEPGVEIAGARWISLKTTRGAIPLILHAAEEPDRAVLCLSGARGGYDGPSRLYAELGRELPRRGISVARLDYRMADEFPECLLDAVAALSFLKGTNHSRAAIVGHSFGGAVAINAGTLSPMVTTVVAISSQLAGAHVVAELAPRPLLLLHGSADRILSHESSEALFERAREPKTLKLFPGADHGLSQAGGELIATVRDWLVERA